MKKGSFASLLYREFYLGRKGYLYQLLTFFIMALMGVLAALSLQKGNLNRLLGLLGDLEPVFRLSTNLYIEFLPGILSSMIIFVPADVAGIDILTFWQRYQHSTPVTPIRFGAVKTAATLLVAGVNMLLATAYIFAVDLILGESSPDHFFLSLSTVICMILFSIGSQVMIYLLKNKDMGAIAAMFLIMAPIAVFFRSRLTSTAAGDELSKLTDQQDLMGAMNQIMHTFSGFFPIAVILLVIGFILMFLSMSLVYKRREK